MGSDRDELIAAAEEALDRMVWILGGFGRSLSKQEEEAALPRYHASIDRLRAALEPYQEALESESPHE